MKKEICKMTGFTFKTTNDKLIIEMPINNLIRGLESDPNNCWNEIPRVTIDRKMKREFAEWVVSNLQDDSDEDENETFVGKMLANLFNRIYEGFENFAIYHEEDEE
jgi:hypothetical protein